MSRNISTVSLLLDFSFLQSYRYFNLAWFTIVEHYTSTWIGINDLNRESSFKWSDGTPFAFMNWADTEPNGNEGENCGEMKMDDWTKGRWNDYICSEPLHFVCEKKGSNYVEPPKPPKPEPQCAEGWQRVADRCIYNSFNFGRTASNWTEAKAVCKGFHEGSTLVSIRNQEDQDSLYCKLSGSLILREKLIVPNVALVMGITFIGGTDANHEGQWTWEDGEPFSYNHWGVNEPNGNETENCLEVDYNLNWNDVECGGQYSKYFMCSSPISKIP